MAEANEPSASDEPSAPTDVAPYDAVARLDADDVVIARMPSVTASRPQMKRRATSDVRSWVSLGLALPLYGLLVLGAQVMPDDVRRLLLERGWIPHAIMLLSCWSLAILVVKIVALRSQERAFAAALLPSDVHAITQANVGDVLAHLEVARASLRRGQSFLIERMVRILEHYAARGDVSETTAVNNTDADTDAAMVASSFSMVKVLVWAIPILGFIGTVIGIGAAVGGFSQSLEGADQLDTIKDSLGDVTSGLAVAFDTTLVALVASILVMLPTSWVQKAEEQLISDVDDYCVANVLRHLVSPDVQVDPAEATDKPPVFDGERLEKLVLDTVAAPLAEMLAANMRLSSQLAESHAALAASNEALAQQLAAFASASQSLGPNVERAVTALGQATSLAERSTDAMGRSSEQLCRELGASQKLMQLLAAGLTEPIGVSAAARSANGANGKSTREI